MPERHAVTRQSFLQEVLPAYQPLVLRGLVSHWPLVSESLKGVEPALHYIMGFDQGLDVDAILARPDALRAIGYAAGLEGFNFVRDRRPLAAIFEQLWRYGHFDEPPCLAVQSAPIREVLPGLDVANENPLLGAEVAPRLWLGNRVTVPAHFDSSHNIACVAAGRRRFTLLPPQCASLLYMGPPDHAPTPAPMSVVPNVHTADAVHFPLLGEALDHAVVAELEPGDALYIPPLWFHQVESLDPHLNILVNYWWRSAPVPDRKDDLHLAAMRLAMLAFRHLPDGEREGWRALFGHYVFGARAEQLAHIPEAQRHMFGDVDAASDAAIRKDISERLNS